VRAANHFTRADVVQLANLNDLGPHEFVLGGLLVFGLRSQERGAGHSRHEVCCPSLTSLWYLSGQFQKRGADPSSHSNQLAFTLQRTASCPASTEAKPSSDPLNNDHCARYALPPLLVHS
jgi:hypothetical protein